MTIDEVIENLKCDIEIDMYIHEIAPQIAEWLEELVDYRRFNGAKTFDNGFKQGEKYGYNKAIDDVMELVKAMITELDVKGCTKYGNKNAEQQNKSYDTLMKYEIAESIDNLLCRLEVLKD